MMKTKIGVEDSSVVDLFCGVGVAYQRLVKEHFNVDAGIDFDASCRYAFEKNNILTFFIEI